ncbi:hypothetical protein JK361_30100 [Streptomyces sp. 5-8]|uniref:Uncharacterized protein n=1 Tax=Streptomyces musisoli TaxID=2802280 RepID=A0ABS1P8T5_9ACTN|nr:MULTISPECIES: hypothetical protein [Streptomyces]MBL1108788.1 hypothetical protein [Streptomyces musisoli]MBY8842916.1 hypothetical protein [Streptomyces sp. SP2-10]
MLPEALTALAAAGGTAVVQAAGTEAWAGFREGAARWFGRGNPQREHAELERLDRTAGELETAGPSDTERVRIRQEAAWQARIEARLEDLADAELIAAAQELRELLSHHAPTADVSAGPGGLAVHGPVTVRAEGGSIAAGIVHGGAHITHPSPPDPHQG